MGAQVTVTLSGPVLRQAEVLAQHVHRPVNEVLAETIELSSLENSSDEEVLAATDEELPTEDDGRLSELLDRKQSGELTPWEAKELSLLMHRYQQGLLRKAEAWRVAADRGSPCNRESPDPP